ncbi:hypothetical protein CLUG_04516 [Clavispora lusitaniae ATCC 42720]|uniref:Uncharacterized protein n=1 Tax=Clavispora lusitaniae (strain ATCC 42720) TaxID=306902 RepID=C4Y8I8_CLAL4|nr:uncharacterized protein CLUG_04516 [Clavispora lusitaniae ATCC 42720]EEQ40387.1 hypothetical protein CLUG_04516 [Clavispora lusitaniae ATCC 42720]
MACIPFFRLTSVQNGVQIVQVKAQRCFNCTFFDVLIQVLVCCGNFSRKDSDGSWFKASICLDHIARFITDDFGRFKVNELRRNACYSFVVTRIFACFLQSVTKLVLDLSSFQIDRRQYLLSFMPIELTPCNQKPTFTGSSVVPSNCYVSALVMHIHLSFSVGISAFQSKFVSNFIQLHFCFGNSNIIIISILSLLSHNIEKFGISLVETEDSADS